MIGGKELTQIVDRILAERGISRIDFCKEIGISSAAYSGWKKGSQPREDKIIAIEKCLGISFSDYEKSDRNSETDEVLQWLREDFSHRALFESAKGLTKEQAYAAASFIEKLKAGET